MSEVPSFIVQQEALDEIGRSLAALLSDGDECVLFVSRWMGPFSEADFLSVRPDGRVASPLGPANDIHETGPSFDHSEALLRRACYQEGKGTWFGLEVKVTPDGAVTAKYNYDTEPNWELPIEPTLYVQEQEKYPRDPEHQPEWFKRRLAEGQAALDEWRRSNGRA